MDVGIRPSRERTTAANAQHNTAVRSVIRTTGYIPGSLAGAHASARSGPQTVAQRGAAGSRRATRARERARSSLSTPAPTLSTLGDLRPTCPPPWLNSLSIVGYLGRGETQSAAPIPTAIRYSVQAVGQGPNWLSTGARVKIGWQNEMAHTPSQPKRRSSHTSAPAIFDSTCEQLLPCCRCRLSAHHIQWMVDERRGRQR